MIRGKKKTVSRVRVDIAEHLVSVINRSANAMELGGSVRRSIGKPPQLSACSVLHLPIDTAVSYPIERIRGSSIE